MTNQVTDLIMSHVSVRKFTDEAVGDEDVQTLIACAQAASSASFEQAVSIVEIADPEVRSTLVEPCGGQEFTTQGRYFLFCGDFHRHSQAAHRMGADISASLGSVDTLIKGVVDATLAAQNFIIAAESMGLGVCVLGGVRDGIKAVLETIDLPQNVFPFFAVVVGHPAERNGLKPRLPMHAVYHKDSYPTDDESWIDEYDETTRAYYAQRGGSRADRTWTSSAVEGFGRYGREYMLEHLREQGWATQR